MAEETIQETAVQAEAVQQEAVQAEAVTVTETEQTPPKLYTAEDAQKMIDSALAKKLKGMPSKAELDEFRDWKKAQAASVSAKPVEATKPSETVSHLEQKLTELENRLTRQAQIDEIRKSGVNERYINYILYTVLEDSPDDFSGGLKSFLDLNKELYSVPTGRKAEIKNTEPPDRTEPRPTGVIKFDFANKVRADNEKK